MLRSRPLVTSARQPPLAYAWAAADSSCWAVPSTFDGFCRKSWKIFHSPCPSVAPNDAGARHDMSNCTFGDVTSTFAICRNVALEYAFGDTFLFAEMYPRAFAHPWAACGVARNLISSLPPSEFLKRTPTSPPVTTGAAPPLIP